MNRHYTFDINVNFSKPLRIVLEIRTDAAELRRLEEALPGLQADTTALNTAVEEAPKP